MHNGHVAMTRTISTCPRTTPIHVLRRTPMKVFSIAVVLVLVLAAGGAFVLNSIQETAAQAEPQEAAASIRTKT